MPLDKNKNPTLKMSDIVYAGHRRLFKAGDHWPLARPFRNNHGLLQVCHLPPQARCHALSPLNTGNLASSPATNSPSRPATSPVRTHGSPVPTRPPSCFVIFNIFFISFYTSIFWPPKGTSDSFIPLLSSDRLLSPHRCFPHISSLLFLQRLESRLTPIQTY